MRGSLERADNLFDYFHKRVDDAHEDAGVTLSPDTRLYLANLLTERARTDLPALPEATLAELHARAAASDRATQIRAYRELGDRALYVLGCFEESLDRKIVGRSYYADMGAAAYWRVDRGFKRWFADAFGPVFRELALSFAGCVDVLTAVRERHDEAHPDAVMRLYRQWQRTGSEDAARRLRGYGVVLGEAEPA